MRNKTLILIFALMHVFALQSFAQTAKQQQRALEKENKAFMKQLKEKYGLKDVFVRVEDDGYWYYALYKKGGICGVADQKGDMIVPVKYDYIDYQAALDESPSAEGSADDVWHRRNEACFHAETFSKKKSSVKYFGIYRLDGTAMVDYLEATNMFNNSHKGYVEFTKGDASNDVRALYTTDGECILPLEYYYIDLKGKICYAHKKYGDVAKGGTLMKGAMALDGSFPAIPCQFSEVAYDAGSNQWMVTDPVTHDEFVFDPSRRMASEMVDHGAELFWSGEYDKVAPYYSEEASDKPWALFYSGAALVKLAEHQELNANCFVIVSKNDQMDKHISESIPVTWRTYYLYKNLNVDVQGLKELYSTGYRLLSAYQEIDSTLVREAMHYQKVDLQHRLSSLDKLDEDFKVARRKFYAEQRAIAAAHEAEQKQKAARRNAIIAGILGAVMQGVANGLTSSSSSRTSGSTYTSSKPVSSVSATSSSASSSSSSSSQSTATQYRQCNKCRGTGDIFTTSTVGTYGQDSKVVCSTCGQEHWKSTVHHHRKCDNCGGTGKVAR